ncbi:MAG: hypothetical protein K9N47_22725 [Prosthecobacter sp.]|uniref:hypothetical protein n=1 Tax=Prosthecobacter sp. TaxID=1965333 RepID=UPI00261DA1C6|nr:hypothetical protein [Prosthecobacter sp.]MCF7788957.1 hypothetical protein [Prosthecobacter sp.]
MLTSPTSRLLSLARGGTASQIRWLEEKSPRAMLPLVVGIMVGCGAYGFAIGLGRSPMMALFVAIKMPLLIFLTLGVNGLINGMFGTLLGSGMSFRQTMQACLMSFALFALIVGSLAPIMIGMALDRPADGTEELDRWYRMFLLSNTAVIAFAGIIANHKLLRLIEAFSGSPAASWRTLVAWLAGNLFVGAQLSYILRPFFGNPMLPIEFLRPDPFHGTFYEAVWSMTLASLPESSAAFGPRLLFLCVLIGWLIARMIYRNFAPIVKSITPSNHEN